MHAIGPGTAERGWNSWNRPVADIQPYAPSLVMLLMGTLCPTISDPHVKIARRAM